MGLPPQRTPRLPARQRGMATILIILLAGLALTVTALGVTHAVRSAQDKQVTVHAATHAQAGAWTGVEVFRQYLMSVNEATLEALAAGQTVNISLGNMALGAVIVQNTVTSGTTRRVTANIRNQDDAARATSVIQAVYQVTPGGATSSDSGLPWSDVLNIYNDLNMSGGISIRGYDNANFNVNGNVSLNNASITGIKTIQATGDISIGSEIAVNTIFSNGNITLTGSASVITASALKNISVSGGGTQGTLNANGNIVITNGTVGAANAVGNVSIDGWPTVTSIRSNATVTCTSQWWTNYSSILAGIAANGCSTNNVTAPAPVSISPMEPFTLTQPKVDAYQLKGSANYVFEMKNGKMKVTVSNINGITSGDYYIGRYEAQNNDRVDYLCKEVNSSGLCTLPASYNDAQTICQGNSDQNTCFSYSNGTWAVTGKNLAAGVMWFDGNLSLVSGSFYDSFIATGNISTSGEHVTTSVNYAGYNTICQNRYPQGATARFAGLYPTNFCGNGALTNNAIGNIGLLAGGYVDGVYSGGVINLGASTEIFGSVIAGDTLLTGGSSTVHGYVTAAGLGNSTSNDWTGSLTIDLTNLPASYDPGGVPDMGNCTSNCDGSSGSTAASAELLWSRYL